MGKLRRQTRGQGPRRRGAVGSGSQQSCQSVTAVRQEAGKLELDTQNDTSQRRRGTSTPYRAGAALSRHERKVEDHVAYVKPASSSSHRTENQRGDAWSIHLSCANVQVGGRWSEEAGQRVYCTCQSLEVSGGLTARFRPSWARIGRVRWRLHVARALAWTAVSRAASDGASTQSTQRPGAEEAWRSTAAAESPSPVFKSSGEDLAGGEP